MNIAIVEDIPAEAKLLSDILSEYSQLGGIGIDIDFYCCAEDFLGDYSPMKYTLIFMDIYLDGMTGVDAVKKIRENADAPLIVFLTTSTDHLFEAFRLHVYDYIAKPAEKKRVFDLMNDILRSNTDVCESLEFKCDRMFMRLKYSDIAYVSASGHIVEIVDTHDEIYKPYTSFSAINDTLSKDKRFLPINRGVLLNMDCIKGFSEGSCVLASGKSFPINVKKRKELEQIWQNYMFAKIRNEIAR